MTALIRRGQPVLRYLSCGLSSSSGNLKAAKIDTLPPRWLLDFKARLGKCLIFGLNAEQIIEAASIGREIGSSWRALLAGSEGYLCGPGRAGLENHRVVWGEMVSFADMPHKAER